MTWYSHSPLNWCAKEEYVRQSSYEITSAQALNSIIDNVNNLIAILKDPTDTTSLRADLSKLEHEKVSKYVVEASQALMKIASDYNVPFHTSIITTLLKPEEEPKISTPQTNHLVSSFNVKEEISVFPALKEHKQFVEVTPPVDNECIAIGRAFNTLEEAAQAFQDYALKCGFNICKGNSKKDVYQEYACSARGKVRMRKIQDQSKRRNRKSIKKMCKCHIILRLKANVWVITMRKLQHTHDLLTIDEIKKTAKNRYIPEDIKERAVKMYNDGETPAKIQYQLESELGDLCTWSMKDLYNMLYRNKDPSIQESSDSS
ncbi:unnamed protein product [Blepharisma stoltei]|uniref:FAR1 domain-containing protein n=1 Tax=Blepharisma stoltei TaxID=1481888 RepID=A0AAU9I7S3_9CILI|nr:unnamed protein product [Blepharisma stoltei]